MKDEKDMASNNSLGDSSTSSLRPHPSSLLFIILSFIAYYSVLNSYFLSDDFVQIGKVLEGDWSVTWAHETGGFFRPLFILSCIVDAFLWRENPFGYHLTNTLLHGINSLLVYSLTLKLLQRQKLSSEAPRAIALVAGLLFLLHPSHTETVSWITGRVDLLPTLLCLTAMLGYISYTETRRILSLVLALLSFALALLAKESAASLPFILFAAGLYFSPLEKRKAALWQSFKASALFFPVLFIFILVRRAALGVWLGGYGASQHLNFSPGWIRDRFLQACLRSLVPALPLELSPVFLKPLQSPIFIIGALAFAALIILLLRRRRRLDDATERSEKNKLVWLLVVMLMLSLLPVMNLRLSIFDTQGERFLYWPSVFTSILVAYVAFILLRSMKWWIVLMLCVLIFYSVSLYRTNQTWREAANLSQSIKDELSRAATPEKSLIVINAPDNLRGVPVYHNGLEDALRLFQKRVRIERVRVWSLHDIQSLNDEVELKRDGDAYALRLLGNVDGFTRVSDPFDCLQTLERSNNSIRFRLDSCPEGYDLFIFNAGKMYRVIDSER